MSIAILAIVCLLVPSGIALVSQSHLPQTGSGAPVLEWTPANNVDSIPVGKAPLGMAVDGTNGYLYVANGGSGNVSVINGVTDSTVGSIPVGPSPFGVAVDAATGYVYVTNAFPPDNVTVIDGATDTVVASIPVGVSPVGVAVDSANGYVYVANDISDNVTVIDGTTDTVVGSIPIGPDSYGVAVDAKNGDVYVTYSSDVSVINGSTDEVVGSIPVGSGPIAVAADSANGDIYVTNFVSDNVSVINGSTDKVIDSIPVGSAPEGVAVDEANGYVYVANAGSNDNNLSVINGATDTVVGSIPAGSGPNDVAVDSANGYVYVTDYSSNSVSVISSPSHVEYLAIFAEVGLPSGPTWYVNITGTASVSLGTRIAVVGTPLPNGSYSYSVGASVVGKKDYSAPGGTFTVNGQRFAKTLTFTAVHRVTFVEKGLPTGTEWRVNITGWGSTSSVGTTLKSWEATGSYPYTVVSANKSYAAPGGTLTVHAKAVSVKMRFHLVTYVMTIAESGLPAKAKWCIDITSPMSAVKKYCTTKASESFVEPNGTYDYSLTTTKAGWSGPGGSFTVTGAAVSRGVTFSE